MESEMIANVGKKRIKIIDKFLLKQSIQTDIREQLLWMV